MISKYSKKLVENLPEKLSNQHEPILIDLILDGGMFNGSYLIGALSFLKEMELKNYIKIRRISGASIGSLMAFIYLLNDIDYMNDIGDTLVKKIKDNYNLSFIGDIKSLIQENIPDNICELVNDKLFISYYNAQKVKKIVKSTYKSKEEIFKTITKSCYLPFVINGGLLYEDKYIDGFTPFIFKKEPNVKILHIELLSSDKFTDAYSIKNENSFTHRSLSGILDIHNFFIKGTKTNMCSYLDEWNAKHQLMYKIKLSFEMLVVYTVYAIIYAKKYIFPYIEDSLFSKITAVIIKDIWIEILRHYCI